MKPTPNERSRFNFSRFFGILNFYNFFNVLHLFEHSPDPDFAEISKMSKNTKNELYSERKLSILKKNFKNIFRQFYSPISSHENVQKIFDVAILDLEIYTFENFRFKIFRFLHHFLKEFLKEMRQNI